MRNALWPDGKTLCTFTSNKKKKKKKKKYYIDYAYWSNEIPKACSTKVTALASPLAILASYYRYHLAIPYD